MQKNFGEQPREENEQENSPTSEELQRLMQNLEMAQRPGPAWNEKNKQETIRKIQEEIDAEKAELAVRQQTEKINNARREEIVERFGPEVLDNKEVTARRISKDIEKHLAKAKNSAEAQKILNLWENFSVAMSNLIDQDAGRQMTDDEPLKAALKCTNPHDNPTKRLFYY